MDIEQLKHDAEIIRNETVPGANTAERIGKMFDDIVDGLEDTGEGSVELLKRIQGKSDNSSPYEDPFKLVRFTGETSWNDFTAWLDELHTSDGTPDNQKAGFFRANINGVQYEVHNLVVSWSDNRFIQVVLGLLELNDDGTLKTTGQYSVVQREYGNGNWTAWNIDTVSGPTETVGTINVNDLDAMFSLTPDSMGYYNVSKFFSKRLPSRWTVVDTTGLGSTEQANVVGTMDVFSDDMRHQVTQVITTHYTLNDDGTGFNGHTDLAIHVYFRSWGFLSSSIERGEWTAWQELSANGGMGISGTVNLAVSEGKTTLQNVYNGLDTNGVTYLLITDSKGNLPSLNDEKTVTMNSEVAKLFGETSMGANVGDIVIVAKVKVVLVNVPVYKILPLNDAKAPDGSFPGTWGQMSPSDKKYINLVPTALQYPMRDGWGFNMNNCLESGVYTWCTTGRPAGSTGAYTLFVNRSTTDDGRYYAIDQTAYGREAEVGQIWKRIIFQSKNGSDIGYNEWVRVDNDGSSDVYRCPGNFMNLHSNQNSISSVVGSVSEFTSAIEQHKVILDTDNHVVLSTNGTEFVFYEDSEACFIRVALSYNKGEWTTRTIYQRSISTSIVNNLTSTSTTAGLSANQGRVLNEKIESLKESVTAVYRPKGSKDTLAEVLALTDAKTGDVWDVNEEFTLGGKRYAAGTNVACIEDTTPESYGESHWDPLGGMITGVLKNTDIVDNLTTEDSGKVLSAKQGKNLDKKIQSLNATAGKVSIFLFTASEGYIFEEEELAEIGLTSDFLTEIINGKTNYAQFEGVTGEMQTILEGGVTITARTYGSATRIKFTTTGLIDSAGGEKVYCCVLQKKEDNTYEVIYSAGIEGNTINYKPRYVLDNLESGSHIDALSAKQGRVLKEKIESNKLIKITDVLSVTSSIFYDLIQAIIEAVAGNYPASNWNFEDGNDFVTLPDYANVISFIKDNLLKGNMPCDESYTAHLISYSTYLDNSISVEIAEMGYYGNSTPRLNKYYIAIDDTNRVKYLGCINADTNWNVHS